MTLTHNYSWAHVEKQTYCTRLPSSSAFWLAMENISLYTQNKHQHFPPVLLRGNYYSAEHTDTQARKGSFLKQLYNFTHEKTPDLFAATMAGSKREKRSADRPIHLWPSDSPGCPHTIASNTKKICSGFLEGSTGELGEVFVKTIGEGDISLNPKNELCTRKLIQTNPTSRRLKEIYAGGGGEGIGRREVVVGGVSWENYASATSSGYQVLEKAIDLLHVHSQ